MYNFSESVGQNAATTLENISPSILAVNVTVAASPDNIDDNTISITHPSPFSGISSTIQVVDFRGSRYAVGTVGGKCLCVFLLLVASLPVE